MSIWLKSQLAVGRGVGFNCKFAFKFNFKVNFKVKGIRCAHWAAAQTAFIA